MYKESCIFDKEPNTRKKLEHRKKFTLVADDKYPDYFTVNIRLEKTFIKHLSLSFSIENIFDQTYVTSDAQKCPGRIITGSVKFIF